MRIVEITQEERLSALKGEWNGLLMRSPCKKPFLSHEWVSSWWACFGKNAELRVLLAKEGDELVGIAPLMITQWNHLGIKLKSLEFIGTGLSDYSDFIIAKDYKVVLSAFIKHLLNTMARSEVIRLLEIPEGSPTAKYWGEIFPKGLSLQYPGEPCPSIDFSKPNNNNTPNGLKPEYWKSKLARLSRKAQVSIKVVKRPESEQLLEGLFAMHINSWKKSMFLDDAYKRFFKGLYAALSPEGRVRLLGVYAGGQPIAALLSFDYAKSRLAYTVAHNQEWRRFSPGMVAIGWDIENAKEEGCLEYDFGRGDEGFKLGIANKLHRNQCILASKCWLLAKPLFAEIRARKLAARLLRRA